MSTSSCKSTVSHAHTHTHTHTHIHIHISSLHPSMHAHSQSTDTQTLYHRFYLSLILHHLLKTTSSNTIWRTANYFQCSRGFLQSVMNSTASFSSCLTHFTQEIPELWSINLLLPVMTKKLAFSASLDLVPLMEITGVKQVHADTLCRHVGVQ